MADIIKVQMAGPRPKAVKGKMGLDTQLPGACITADSIGCSRITGTEIK